MPNGQMTVGDSRTVAGYLNNPAFTKQIYAQARVTSGVFGALSKKIGESYGRNTGTETDMKIAKTAAFLRIEKKEGDTHNWTMEKTLTGPPTFGDRVPETAGTLSFLHAEVKLNKTRSPAFQIPAEMEQIKAAAALGAGYNWKSAIRSQEAKWHGEAIGHEAIIASLKGASDNLLSSKQDGGLGVDLGRGAGVQVSPLNAIVVGQGKVSGATLADREADLKTKLGNITNATASHLISLKAVHIISEELSCGLTGMVGLDMGGKEKFVLVLPSVCRRTLQGPDSTMVDYAKFTKMWGKDSPLLQYSPVEIGNIVVLYDDYLSKYSPDVTGTEIVWGKPTTEFQSWGYTDLATPQLTRGVGLLYGARAILEATNGDMKFTNETGKHETSEEVSSMIKRSMIRASWKDVQDSNVLPKDYGTMLVAFAHHGITHT